MPTVIPLPRNAERKKALLQNTLEQDVMAQEALLAQDAEKNSSTSSSTEQNKYYNHPRVITFGCRLNSFESELIEQQWQEHSPSNNPEEHHRTVIINTCAVTHNAVQEARRAVRKAAKEDANAHIVVTGCAAQVSPELFARMPEVGAVVGNSHKFHRDKFLRQPRKAPVISQCEGDDRANSTLLQNAPSSSALPSHTPTVEVDNPHMIKDHAPHMINAFINNISPDCVKRSRAFVAVQQGCDHACTFCIIPRARGGSWSIPPSIVVQRIDKLLSNGVKEIVLTGVDLTSYRYECISTQRTFDLSDLVSCILDASPHLLRLRLSSLDCVEIPDRLVELFAHNERLLPHVHLSLQSGDDLILKRMGRRHGSQHALSLCQRLRAVRPDIVFGADIIVGFPTETDDMFRNTMKHVEQCNISLLHVFSYSPRPQTPAALIPRQVNHEIKKQRSQELRTLGARLKEEKLSQCVGETLPILFEHVNTGDSTYEYTAHGHSDHFLPAVMYQPSSLSSSHRAENTLSTALHSSITWQVLLCKVVGHDGQRLIVEDLNLHLHNTQAIDSDAS